MSDEIEAGLLRGRAAHFARALAIPFGIFAAVIACAIALTPMFIGVAPVAVMVSVLVALFRLGRINATPNALEKLSQQDILSCIQRHQAGDWGDVDDHDRGANNRALGCFPSPGSETVMRR